MLNWDPRHDRKRDERTSRVCLLQKAKASEEEQ